MSDINEGGVAKKISISDKDLKELIPSKKTEPKVLTLRVDDIDVLEAFDKYCESQGTDRSKMLRAFMESAAVKSGFLKR
jgi:hypothetical protein